MKKPLHRGQLLAFANHIGQDRHKVKRWRNAGKLDEWIRSDGTLDIEAAARGINAKVAPRQQAAANARWKKTGKSIPKKDETESALKKYLKETLGDIEQCDFSELQRRNELEKLLLARIKRGEIEKELVPLSKVKKQATECAMTAKSQVVALPDRFAAILATVNDPFEIRRIMKAEVRHILETISSGIEEKRSFCPHCKKAFDFLDE
jgi:seryl-tRNA synthetase